MKKSSRAEKASRKPSKKPSRKPSKKPSRKALASLVSTGGAYGLERDYRGEARFRAPGGLGYGAMITVGCAGFPVPATRYFREFAFGEVQETHLSLPGRGTIRRWRREAPDGFRFALLGPRNVGQEGFRVGKVNETALDR